MATGLLYAFSVLAVAGGVFLLVIVARWGWVRQWYTDLIPKLLVAAARLGSAIATVATRFSGMAGQPTADTWNAAFVVGAVSWTLWEIVQMTGDHKAREAIKLTQGLEKQVWFRMSMLTSLRKLVHVKIQRIMQQLSENPLKKVSIERVRKALEPKEQIYLALEYMAAFLGVLHREPDSEAVLSQNFRVGLYAAKDGVMNPWVAFDSSTRTPNPFSSHLDSEERFRLGNATGPSEVVKAVNQGRFIIVSDCLAEAAKGNFVFFSERQKNYLKSMLAYPILSFRRPDGTITKAAFVIDTDVPGYFKEEDRRVLQVFLEEFAARISLETLLINLLGFQEE